MFVVNWFALLLALNCLCTVTSYTMNRIKRAGGRVVLSDFIRPPARMQKHETRFAPPGWTHCIKKIEANSQWKAINTKKFKFHTTQFQCTWYVSASKTGVDSSLNTQIHISIQRLKLGKEDDKDCKQNFLELIDNGKSQGRFCDKQRPGDYISIGDHVRIDIQGEGTLAKLVKAKGKEPFLIHYRAVGSQSPGFRNYVTSASNFKNPRLQNDRRAAGGLGNTKRGSTPTSKKDRKASSNEEDGPFGSLGLAGGIALAACGALILLIFTLIAVKQFCGDTKKNKVNKDKPDYSTSTEDLREDSLPTYEKATGLASGHRYALLEGQKQNHSAANELIMASKVVKPAKSATSSSEDKKKRSSNSQTKPSAANRNIPAEKKGKASSKSNQKNKRAGVVSKRNIRQSNKDKNLMQVDKISATKKRTRKTKDKSDPVKSTNTSANHKHVSEEKKRRKRTAEKDKTSKENAKKKSSKVNCEEEFPIRRFPKSKKSAKECSKSESKHKREKQKTKTKSTVESSSTKTKMKQKTADKVSSKSKKRSSRSRKNDKATSQSTDPTPRTRYKSKTKPRKKNTT